MRKTVLNLLAKNRSYNQKYKKLAQDYSWSQAKDKVHKTSQIWNWTHPNSIFHNRPFFSLSLSKPLFYQGNRWIMILRRNRYRTTVICSNLRWAFLLAWSSSIIIKKQARPFYFGTSHQKMIFAMKMGYRNAMRRGLRPGFKPTFCSYVATSFAEWSYFSPGNISALILRKLKHGSGSSASSFCTLLMSFSWSQ